MDLLTLRKTVEAVALVLWGGVFAFFCHRFLQRRKIVSLGIAIMSLGWVLVAYLSPQLGLKLSAVAAGAFLWWAVAMIQRDPS